MKKIVLIFNVIIVMSCGENVEPNENQLPGNFAHTVYFWLENPTDEADRTAFETSLKKFINKSPYIKTKHIGVPAKTDRDVIDNSYTYSLLLTFSNKDDQDLYQDEPNHKIFIEESSRLWTKVIVYDSENIYNQ